MKSKKYGLTKQEMDKLNRIVNLVSTQEEIIIALKKRFECYLKEELFKRLKIEPDLFQYSAIDFGTGQLIINIPNDKKK